MSVTSQSAAVSPTVSREPEETVNSKIAAKPQYFDPENYLISALKRAVSNKQDVVIESKGIGKITVLSSRGEYFLNSGDMEMLCQADNTLLEVTVLKGNADTSYAKQIGRNISELLWNAGFYASGGRLMKGLLRDDVVELIQWPNFTRIPMTANSMRMTALLHRHPTSITLATRLLKVDTEDAYRFYTAAHCAGIAKVLNHKPAEPELKPHRNQALLGLLLSKIAGL
jgi:hypothetical protein